MGEASHRRDIPAETIQYGEEAILVSEEDVEDVRDDSPLVLVPVDLRQHSAINAAALKKTTKIGLEVVDDRKRVLKRYDRLR
jgi:hypothetical protein